MYRSGAFVAEHVSPTTDEQVQPNGVDLTLAAVHQQDGPGRIARDGKEIGERRRLPVDAPDEAGQSEESVSDRTDDGTGGNDGTGGADGAGGTGGTYTLQPGGYVVTYGETIAVPDDHVGFVYPRSSLLRNSCMLNTAVWDAGYEGRGEGLLQVHHEINLEDGARIAQFVLARAAHEDTYDGSYQGENL